jgi:chromate transport protein ChrA
MERKRKWKVLVILLVIATSVLVSTASLRFERMTTDERLFAGLFRVIVAMCFVIVFVYCYRFQDEMRQRIIKSSLLTGLATSFVSLILADSLYCLAPGNVTVREAELFWIVAFVLGCSVGQFFGRRKYACI